MTCWWKLTKSIKYLKNFYFGHLLKAHFILILSDIWSILRLSLHKLLAFLEWRNKTNPPLLLLVMAWSRSTWYWTICILPQTNQCFHSSWQNSALACSLQVAFLLYTAKAFLNVHINKISSLSEVFLSCFKTVINMTNNLNRASFFVYCQCAFGCSAGVGRTGTYVALDYLLNQAKAEGVVNVFECLKEMRSRRPCMIQTVVRVVLV